MTRIFLDLIISINDEYKLTSQQENHLLNVLRYNNDDEVEVVCTKGNLYIGQLVIEQGASRIRINKQIDKTNEPYAQITIFQGIPKKDKFEQIIKMGTEIGAVSFVPVAMDRSVAKIKNDKVDKLLERWGKIALAAAKQSKRNYVPSVRDPISFDQLIGKVNDYDMVICFYENENQVTLNNLDFSKARNIAIIVGPEGGISDKEIERAKEENIIFSSLGKRILRTETAGVTALSIILYLTGDI